MSHKQEESELSTLSSLTTPACCRRVPNISDETSTKSEGALSNDIHGKEFRIEVICS